MHIDGAYFPLKTRLIFHFTVYRQKSGFVKYKAGGEVSPLTLPAPLPLSSADLHTRAFLQGRNSKRPADKVTKRTQGKIKPSASAGPSAGSSAEASAPAGICCGSWTPDRPHRSPSRGLFSHGCIFTRTPEKANTGKKKSHREGYADA